MSAVGYFCALLGEATKSWAARAVPAAVSSLVVALVVLATLLTTGNTAAQEQQILSTVDALGTRLITVVDRSDAQMGADSVHAIGELEGVSWVIGLGPAVEFRNSAVPRESGVAFRALVGDLPAEVEVVAGRTIIRPGEAVIGAEARQRLGLLSASGGAGDGEIEVAVVGEIAAQEPLTFLNRGGLYISHDPDATLRYLYILAEDATRLPELEPAILAAAHSHDPRHLDLSYSEGALRLREVLAGQLSANSRQIMLGILLVGFGLVTVTFFGAVNGRRRDIGRRRALGASRSAIVSTVLMESAISGLVGVSGGTIVGLVILNFTAGILPAPEFTAGVGVLTFLMTLLGAVAPAVTASRRDPVGILRVP